MILDIVRVYKAPFILPPRQLMLPNLYQLIKEAKDLVDQEVQEMLLLMLKRVLLEFQIPKRTNLSTR